MEETLEIKQGFFKGKRLIIAISVAVVIILISTVAGFLVATLSTDKIYDGVFIGELDVSSMTVEEANDAVLNIYSVSSDTALTLSCKEISQSVDVKELNPEIIPEKMTEAAYLIGREGSFFARIKDIYNTRKNTFIIPAEATINKDVLLETIRTIAAEATEPGQENSFELGENELIITRGHSGKRINEEKAVSLVCQSLLKDGENNITLPLESVDPMEITTEYINSEICGEVKDATYRIEEGKIIIEPEKTGVVIDKAVVDEILKDSQEDIIRIPATITMPTVTEKQLNETIFADCLATYSSRYNAGDVNRSYNVALACKNINELILMPGDVFSYNDSVGPRTTARGFRIAHVYVGNRVEDGVGGGICQVSSTLYNTVVLSDLEIVTRTNHSLPVSYVPMGRDATVSYGSIDFQFKNNTKMPVKISAYASGGTCSVSIYGTKENPERSISIESVCTATYPANLEQIEDPTLPEGTIEVEQTGSNGSTYQTYKVISENGKVISREPLAKSRYVVANRIERVGTMVPDAPLDPDMPTPENPDETVPSLEPTESAAPAETAVPTAPPAETAPITPTPAPQETANSGIKPINPAA